MLLAGTQLSEAQIATLLRNAGFTGNDVARMVCTAKYESAYYDHASNTNSNGSVDYGLFQINSIHLGSSGCATTATIYNTTTNTHCAREIFESQGINAWYGYQKHKTECDSFVLPASASGSSTSSSSTSSGSSGSGSSTSSGGSSSSGSSASGSSGSSGSSSTPAAGSGSDDSSDDGSDDSSDDGSSSSSSSSAGSCWSATLSEQVSEDTCVNSAYDNKEEQCIGGQWYSGVSDGVGPDGPCSVEE
jgi:hypothetical protein